MAEEIIAQQKAAHTPGPWKVRAGHFCDDGIPAYEVEMNGDATVNAADAKLIAASPDLLAALKWIQCQWVPGTKTGLWVLYERVNAVIAKAEGRS